MKNIFRKPRHFTLTNKLSWDDNLCIQTDNKETRCMKVRKWIEIDPIALVRDNVLQNGPFLSHAVYKRVGTLLKGVNFKAVRNNSMQSRKCECC